ncbi:class I adenylate-forming enzyme family protein [Rhodococcus sp. NPDC060084]|uniref:class I adenylate-forming enzyme family protein n=1 Tax=Rhodococcus sp. NPDC060084 TaxID=3347053 RepID=UPI003651A791
MSTGTNTEVVESVSIVSGPPLSEEPGLGALTLPGFLREVTELYSDREALVMHDADGTTRWTYDDLWERAVEVARALRAVGLSKDGRVGVLMTNRPEWIAAVFGTSLAGGVAVTLSTFSTPAELDYMLETSGVSVLLFERTVLKTDFAAALAGLEPQIGTATSGVVQSAKYPFLRYVAMVGSPDGVASLPSWEEFLAHGEAQPRALVESSAAAVRPSDVAVLFFSSGSTSKPKGILSAHRGVSIQMWRFRRMYRFAPEHNIRCWTANGYFWSGNFAMALGNTLASGGCLVLQPTFDPVEALDLIEKERVNFPFAWPHQWAQLVGAPNWDSADLSSLLYVDFNTPVARHPTVTAEWYEPGHAYGNTETFTISACYPANTPADVAAGSSGEPLPGVTIEIVEPLTGAVLPRGERGEICVKSPTLMLGYVGTPLSETVDEHGFFHTGDGGYLDEAGRLFWEGRLTDIIKTGGANVSPLEVDEALVAHPGVKVARTVGVPHDTLGEVVVSCIVAHSGADLDVDGIRSYLRERLASYKVPREVLFFDEDEISLTGSAKIKSNEIRDLAVARLGVN